MNFVLMFQHRYIKNSARNGYSQVSLEMDSFTPPRKRYVFFFVFIKCLPSNWINLGVAFCACRLTTEIKNLDEWKQLPTTGMHFAIALECSEFGRIVNVVPISLPYMAFQIKEFTRLSNGPSRCRSSPPCITLFPTVARTSGQSGSSSPSSILSSGLPFFHTSWSGWYVHHN